MKILAVVFAPDIKAIPRLYLRFLVDRPLVDYAVAAANHCPGITGAVVLTDDEELRLYLEGKAIPAIHVQPDPVRFPDDKVVAAAIEAMEKQTGNSYDAVALLAAYRPLLRWETLNRAIAEFAEGEYDVGVGGSEKTLRARAGNVAAEMEEDGYSPVFTIARKERWFNEWNTGQKKLYLAVDDAEALEIRDAAGWGACQAVLGRKTIVFRADGHRTLGMGHIYHCLTLANRLPEHRVIFASKRQYPQGVGKITASGFPCELLDGDADFMVFLERIKPDILVNDCLNTTGEYMQELKKRVPRVVTIEDLGDGAFYADAVINALYEENFRNFPNAYFGNRYVCLRDEFLLTRPKPFSEKVENVYVMFGGSDPANLTQKVYRFALEENADNRDIAFWFVTGLAYDHEKHGVVPVPEKNIHVVSNAPMVTKYLSKADIAITSQGRGSHEVAYLGVPTIIMAMNPREQTHRFAQMTNGFINLGLGRDVSGETLRATFHYLRDTPQIRREMRDLMLTNDMKDSIDIVIDIILGRYRR